MGWLCCYGAGDSVPTASGRVDGSKPRQRAPVVLYTAMDDAIVAEHRSSCCVLARKTSSSQGACIITRDGIGGHASDSRREDAGAMVFVVVAANERCLAHLEAQSLGDAAIALSRAAHGSKLFWVALESSISDGDAAGHLAAALPDGTVVSFSACSWQQDQAVMLEWQEPAPTATAQPALPLLPDPASARSHELVSDERFPAALT